MGAMKEIATELEFEWTRGGEMYWRAMPTGELAIIQPDDRGYTLTVGVKEVWAGDGIVGAVVAAGALARKQLADQMRRWTAA